MAEGTPAVGDLTIVWRPMEEAEFRIDHVTCEMDKSAAIYAAAGVYIEEVRETDGLTPESVIKGGYDLIAIFDGHLKEAFSSW